MKPRTSIELKIFNINKLLRQAEMGRITLQEAQINRRIRKLRDESEIGAMWADDLDRKYIEMVKKMNN